MGLDLFHAIPSLKTNDTLEYLTMDEFESEPTFLQKHFHLIAEIEESEYNFEILVFPDHFTKELIINRTPSYVDKPTLVGEIDNLNLELNKLAIENSIKKTDPLILKSIDNLLTGESAREVFYHTVSYETGSKKIKGLYWTTKGYQRKGMNKDFYKDFENCKLYFDKASVLKASLYLKSTKGSGDLELKKEFKKNFIDNFIEGESIFFGSW